MMAGKFSNFVGKGSWLTWICRVYLCEKSQPIFGCIFIGEKSVSYKLDTML